jgi:hypothetical protein
MVYDRYLFWLWFVTIISLWMPNLSRATALECSKAKTKIEKLICADRELVFTEWFFDNQYRRALSVLPSRGKSKLIQEQRYWLRNVRDRCEDEDCLKHVYRVRGEVVDRQFFAYMALGGGIYRLITGQHFAVCRELEQNLNRFQKDPPMVCGLRFRPHFKDFKHPDWEDLNPCEFQAAVRSMIDLEIRHMPNWKNALPEQQQQELEKRLAEIRLAFERNQVKLQRARFDLDRHEGKETVLRLEVGNCEPARNYDSSIGYWDRWAVVKNNEEMDDRYGVWSRDVFLHQGRAYLAAWGIRRDPLEPDDTNLGYIRIYEPYWLPAGFGGGKDGIFGVKTYPLCQYQYQK